MIQEYIKTSLEFYAENMGWEKEIYLMSENLTNLLSILRLTEKKYILQNNSLICMPNEQ